MAELSDAAQARYESERELQARIGELETLLAARTATIVGLSAQLAEYQGSAPSATGLRLAEAERQLAALQATKVIRYSALPRRIYAKLRGGARG